MFVDIDDLRAEIRSLAQEAVEEFVKEDDPYLALVRVTLANWKATEKLSKFSMKWKKTIGSEKMNIAEVWR